MFFLPIGLFLINPHICSNYKLAHMVTYITFLGWIPESDDKQRKKSSISKLNLEDGKLPLLLGFFFFFNPKRNFISSWSRSQRVSPPTKLLGSLRKVVSEKAMAPHSSTLAWKIPWTEEPVRLQSMGSLRVGHDWATSLSRIGEGNGNPLQCSCLENPRDRGASWAAVFGVAQSRTQLRRLSSSSSSSSSMF